MGRLSIPGIPALAMTLDPHKFPTILVSPSSVGISPLNLLSTPPALVLLASRLHISCRTQTSHLSTLGSTSGKGRISRAHKHRTVLGTSHDT